VLLVLPLREDRREDRREDVGAERSASGWRGFEGWRPLKQEDRANYDWMHEMLYEVVVHSEAYARAEWRGAAPWAPPTSATLPPGGSATYGLRMILARDVESVGEALLAAGVPVATPLPAATLHADMTDARLHLSTPKGLEVVGSPLSDPPGCLEAAPLSSGTAAGHGLRLRPVAVGRCRLTLRYRWGPPADRRGELLQFVHYNLLEPAVALLQRHGNFASTVGWLPGNGSDPWHRGPGYMGTDADADGGRGGALLYEPRVFMAGHSDESGASAPLAMSVKQLGLPSDAEVAKLEEYVHETLWAGASGRRSSFLQGADHSVRLSMLYWNDAMDKDPSGPARKALPALYDHCHKCWASCKKGRDCCYWMHCWSEEHSLETWRAYNYPHVTVGYWSLYRVARHISPPPTKRAGWRWYLEQAGRTAVAMHTFGGRGTSQWGLMVGSIFVAVLADLRREGLTALADELEAVKERRMRKWMSMLFPYGSEFPWDSTGHEEIHSWLLHDGKVADANKTVQAVLAYSTVVPHWAYCGSARRCCDASAASCEERLLTPVPVPVPVSRYWDFTINGKTQWGNEREFHHYGATLNAVAVLDSFRAFPERHYLLRLGACALLGRLSSAHACEERRRVARDGEGCEQATSPTSTPRAPTPWRGTETRGCCGGTGSRETTAPASTATGAPRRRTSLACRRLAGRASCATWRWRARQGAERPWPRRRWPRRRKLATPVRTCGSRRGTPLAGEHTWRPSALPSLWRVDDSSRSSCSRAGGGQCCALRCTRGRAAARPASSSRSSGAMGARRHRRARTVARTTRPRIRARAARRAFSWFRSALGSRRE